MASDRSENRPETRGPKPREHPLGTAPCRATALRAAARVCAFAQGRVRSGHGRGGGPAGIRRNRRNAPAPPARQYRAARRLFQRLFLILERRAAARGGGGGCGGWG